MSKRILVTGGAGFIGARTVEFFLQEGLEVTVLDNLSSGSLCKLDLHNPKLEFVKGDVCDYSTVLNCVSRSSVILHLAGCASVTRSLEDPAFSLKNNTLGFLNVLQAVRANKAEMRIVYASSAAVYGACTRPCDDTVPLREAPLSPYALDKINLERYAELFHVLFDVKSLGLRYFNVYGPGQSADSSYSGVISIFLNSHLKGTPLTVFGDGLQTRDFIHVSDVARANLLACFSESTGIVNIGAGISYTLLELIGLIERAGARKAIVKHASPKAEDIRRSCSTTKKCLDMLNFKPSVELADGVEQLFTLMSAAR